MVHDEEEGFTMRHERTDNSSVAPAVAALVAMVLLSTGAVLIDGSATSGGGDTPDIETIIERYIEAVGGREAITALSTRITTGRVIDDRPYRGPVVTEPFVCHVQVPDRWALTVADGDAARREGFDGQSAWRADADSVRSDQRARRSKLAWVMNPQGPLRLRQYFGELELTGSERVGGRLVYVVETDRKHAHYSLRFDAASGLLVQIGYYWTLEDYREVDGVLVPFRIAMSRKGGSTTYVVDRLEHGAAIDESLLAAPAVR
jgi:hypothetical protein